MNDVYYIAEIEGDTSFQHVTLDVVIVGAKFKITTKITGYTIQTIYGSYTGEYSADEKVKMKYSAIVVPTYKLELYNSQHKLVKSFSVTRDSWFSRGFEDVSKWNIFSHNDGFRLINRHFEPKNATVNLYDTTPLGYPHGCKGIDAFALRQNGIENLEAECHSKEQNTEINGTTPIDDARIDLCSAKGVMIHIGGWYYNEGENKNKLAGSYGCFGFTPSFQILKTEEEAQKILLNNTYGKWKTSNEEYKAFLKIVSKTKGNLKNKVHVVIEKRTEVENFKDADYETY